MDLTLTIHVIRADRPGPQIGSVGAPKARIEGASQLSQAAMHYISSFIVHGVFEKFPSLRVVVTEFGVDWLPYVMWRLDQNYDLLKHESPWVKKWPSDYIREHIKLSTQPIVESPDDRGGTASSLPVWTVSKTCCAFRATTRTTQWTIQRISLDCCPSPGSAKCFMRMRARRIAGQSGDDGRGRIATVIVGCSTATWP